MHQNKFKEKWISIIFVEHYGNVVEQYKPSLAAKHIWHSHKACPQSENAKRAFQPFPRGQENGCP